MQSSLHPEAIYHIYTHANGFENLFKSEENYRYFLQKYSEYIYPVAETYAYCLMPNHLHLMVEIRKEEEVLKHIQFKRPTLQGFQTLGELDNNRINFPLEISRCFSHLFNGYTQAFNKMYSRKGSLFIPNFKRKEVKEASYITQLIAYIHNNPVKHGFVKRLEEWPHSSFHAYLLDKPSRINREYFKEWFGNKEALIKFHKSISLKEQF